VVFQASVVDDNINQEDDTAALGCKYKQIEVLIMSHPTVQQGYIWLTFNRHSSPT